MASLILIAACQGSSASAQGHHDPGAVLDPGDGFDRSKLQTTYRAGLESLKNGDCVKAEQKFRVALKTAKRNANIHFLAGTANRCQAEYEAAASHFAKAIRYAPSMYVAYKALGVTYLALGKSQLVLDQLAKLESMQSECKANCPPELAAAHSDLKSAIEAAKLN